MATCSTLPSHGFNEDEDDIPFGKTVVAVGEGSIEPVMLPNGTPAIPLQRTVTIEDGLETTCSIEGTTDFETLIHSSVYPDLLEVNRSTYNDRGILAPINGNIDSTTSTISP